MTRPVPFVATLRSRPDIIRIGTLGPDAITLRVEMPEVWDTVRIECAPGEPVLSVKVRALEALLPSAAYHDEFVTKLNGFEILDENAPLIDVGATNGSIFLITYRRRRPVR